MYRICCIIRVRNYNKSGKHDPCHYYIYKHSILVGIVQKDHVFQIYFNAIVTYANYTMKTVHSLVPTRNVQFT
jgi:hypothetical protein